MIIEIKTCRDCGSPNITKNGHCKTTKKQKFHCKACNKYGTLELEEKCSESRKQEIMSAYLERPSMRGIARVFHISRNTLRAWLMAAGQEQSTIEETLHDVPTTGDILEYDELQHFVKKNTKKVVMDSN